MFEGVNNLTEFHKYLWLFNWRSNLRYFNLACAKEKCTLRMIFRTLLTKAYQVVAVSKEKDMLKKKVACDIVLGVLVLMLKGGIYLVSWIASTHISQGFYIIECHYLIHIKNK